MTDSSNPLHEIRELYEAFPDGFGPAEHDEFIEILASTVDPDGIPLAFTAEAILAERLTHPGRGYDADHDEGHVHELLAAADCYRSFFLMSISCADDKSRRVLAEITIPPQSWPWHGAYWHPSPDPIRNIVKAGALYAAAGDAVKRFLDEQ